jgi:hypothetical protein
MNIQIAVAVLLLAASFAQACAFGQSTVFDYAQKQALQEYPDLGVKDSVFNVAFLQAVREKTATDPAFFGHGEWPLTLARAIAPDRVYLKFTVFQNVSDGSLLDAYSGTMGEVKKLVDWAAPSLLDGHRRADVKVEPGIIWSGQESMVFVAGLEGYAEKQSGQIAVFAAGEYRYSTLLGISKSVPCYATSASLALQLARQK